MDAKDIEAEEAVAATETLDREKALTLSALAAKGWCARATPDHTPNRELLAALMSATAWVNRSRRHRRLDILAVYDLTNSFARAVSEWLPGAGDFALVEDGQPTPICLDYADEAGSSVLEEVEQRVIKLAMINVAGDRNAVQRYTEFRRFLVTNAFAAQCEAAEAIQRVGLDLARCYGHVAASARGVLQGHEMFYPCPRCRWPMTRRGAVVSCERSPSCLNAGARFMSRGESLIALGPLQSPDPVVCEGQVALVPGVWRYTVLPGLEEIDLAKRLDAIPGAQVELWPYVDAYDLDVRIGERQWRVDVKDYASLLRLVRHLRERPARTPMWIVVPDIRREQVPVLQRNVPADAHYSFACTTEFIRLVRAAS